MRRIALYKFAKHDETHSSPTIATLHRYMLRTPKIERLKES
ncbi:MAG: hypothetical protein O3B13_16420 [Planctomycetota bacterium]|nr:hypothetical protein [Planctomycetota bacterium]MDA1164677.1 hypothetical protein [Planctomycetota bacterium]